VREADSRSAVKNLADDICHIGVNVACIDNVNRQFERRAFAYCGNGHSNEAYRQHRGQLPFQIRTPK